MGQRSYAIMPRSLANPATRLSTKSGKVTNIVWVSFEFDSVGKPVLDVLRSALDGTADALRKIRAALVAGD